MTKQVAIISGCVAILSSALLWWSHSRMESCGYDCGLFAVTSGPAAIAVVLVAAIVLVVALGGLGISLGFEWLSRRVLRGGGSKTASGR